MHLKNVKKTDLCLNNERMKLWLRLDRLIFSRLSCLVMQKKFNDCYSAVTQHSQNPDIEEVLDAAGEVSSCIQLVDENNPNLKTINLSISSTKLQLKRKAMDEARAEYLRDRTDENLNKAIQKENNRIPLKIENVYIVKKIEIPISIVECGFLSNKQEEQELRDDEYEQKLAWGIYNEIDEYFN